VLLLLLHLHLLVLLVPKLLLLGELCVLEVLIP
jgi:hypothetical protein